MDIWKGCEVPELMFLSTAATLPVDVPEDHPESQCRVHLKQLHKARQETSMEAYTISSVLR
jgi:hypothetical protein